jgi:hypothetical protein
MTIKNPLDDLRARKAPPEPITPIPYIPQPMQRVMENAVSHQPKLRVGSGGKLSVELPVKPPVAGFQSRVLDRLRTPEEVAAGINSPCSIGGSPIPPGIGDITDVGPDEDVELNEIHRFRLEPGNAQPVEFVGELIGRGGVERGGNQKTWAGLYRTRGGKFITEINRWDGRSRNVSWDLGDQLCTVKVFESRDEALASIKSDALRNQILNCLGLLTTRFVE